MTGRDDPGSGLPNLQAPASTVLSIDGDQASSRRPCHILQGRFREESRKAGFIGTVISRSLKRSADEFAAIAPPGLDQAKC